MEHTISPFESLANAIILRAVNDYREALRTLSRYPHDRNARGEKQSITRFFCSDWFGVLTQLDPEMLIRKLGEEVA